MSVLSSSSVAPALLLDGEQVTTHSVKGNSFTPYPPYPDSQERNHGNSRGKEEKSPVRTGQIGSDPESPSKIAPSLSRIPDREGSGHTRTSVTESVRPDASEQADLRLLRVPDSRCPRYVSRVHERRCPRCPRLAVPGRVLCADCADRAAKAQRSKRAELRERRVCCVCSSAITGEQRSRSGKLFVRCEDCRASGRREQPKFQRLTRELVLDLRAAYKRGYGELKQRARELGIKYPNAWKAATGVTWRQVA